MIKFKEIKWKNFLSTGNHFNVINLDTNATTLIIGENGAGKSTFIDALCFSLFGKPFRKNITKSMLVNSFNKKDVVVEVTFSKGQDDYRVVRGIKPNVFEVYKNGSKLNQNAKTKDDQSYLEKTILGMNYKSFTQIVILGASSFTPFMELSAADRRAVIEDILDIKIFSLMNELLKEKIKDTKVKVQTLEGFQTKFKDKITSAREFIDNYNADKQDAIDSYQKLIDHNTADTQKLQEKLKRLTKSRKKLTEEIESYSLETLSKELDKTKNIKYKLTSKTELQNKTANLLTQHESCPTCKQSIDSDFRNSFLEDHKKFLDEVQVAIETIGTRIDKFEKNIERIRELQNDVARLDLKKTEIEKYIEVNNQQIETCQNSIDKVNTSDSDYYLKLSVDLKKWEKQLTEVEEALEKALIKREVQTDATKLLKDDGIKAKIIDSYIPIINNLIAQYLDVMGLLVGFELDSSFNETLKSQFRAEFRYESFSQGEKKRIDLAILFTWREIAKIKQSVNTNLLIMDEIFESSLDEQGTTGLFQILDKLKVVFNIFVISHNVDMIQDKFDNHITIKKVGNFSEVE